MEYEYCYKVDDLKDYLDYIKDKYEFKEKYQEKRIIYRNNDKIARITYKDNEMYLDFKENKISNSDLIIRRESKKIKFDDLDSCEDILAFLNYEKDNTITRIRSIFTGEDIKFEIDEYIEPEKSYVLSFEGKKEVCDAQNKEFSKLNKIHKL